MQRFAVNRRGIANKNEIRGVHCKEGGADKEEDQGILGWLSIAVCR